jgi:hypothetical protein
LKIKLKTTFMMYHPFFFFLPSLVTNLPKRKKKIGKKKEGYSWTYTSNKRLPPATKAKGIHHCIVCFFRGLCPSICTIFLLSRFFVNSINLSHWSSLIPQHTFFSWTEPKFILRSRNHKIKNYKQKSNLREKI